MSAPVIAIERLSVRYDRHTVLADVDLSVEAGDYLAVVGPNGGGKTTLLRAVLGLVAPASGSIRVLGQRPAEARGRIGYVPQYARFDRDFPIPVRDVVQLGQVGRSGLWPWGRRQQIRDRVEAALTQVGMLDHADAPIGALSGGQMQRVLIARALVIDPALLLLDEPTASLDAQGAQGFYQLLDSLSASCTVVLVSHDIAGLTPHVKRMALVNRHLQCALASEVRADMIEKVYCCPLDLNDHVARHHPEHGHDHDHDDDHAQVTP